MHIVTASDNNYVTGVFVLMSSAARHNPLARFTILTTNWSEQSIAHLSAFRARTGLRIDTIEITAQSMITLPITRSHLTRSTYARLFIPELLRQDDRVIYMDCDMLVTGSLQEAWECDLQGYILAAVRCPTPTKAFARVIDLPIEQYFNGGFLVFSLEAWRAQKFGEACLASVTAPDCVYLSQDESALNDHARNRVNYLSAGLNLYAQDMHWQTPYANPTSIRVIHFVTRPKPWNGPCPFGELWMVELRSIPEIEGFKVSPEAFRSRISRMNRLRRVIMGKLSGKSKYRGSREVKHFIHKILVPNFLAKGHFPDKGFPSP